MGEITVVGGGIAGLVAATACAEAGRPVRLLEARSRVGGRGRATEGQWLANLGPHAVYTGGALHGWLEDHGLAGRLRRGSQSKIRFRSAGKRRRAPDPRLLSALPLLMRPAPVDESLESYVCRHAGPELARVVGNFAANVTFDHDPGRLSAASVIDRLRRVNLSFPLITRYPQGGWTSMVEGMRHVAEEAGVRIETSSRVDEMPGGPVIVAAGLAGSRRLLDEAFPVEAPRAALLDVGLAGRATRHPLVVVDFDRPVFGERISDADRACAPPDHDLIQVVMGVRAEADLEGAVSEMERYLDVGWPDWRGREVWRRQQVAVDSSGVVDLPGRTWRDRPSVRHADGVWLAGDWVAAPGHLSEVSVASGLQAAADAVRAVEAATRGAGTAPAPT